MTCLEHFTALLKHAPKAAVNITVAKGGLHGASNGWAALRRGATGTCQSMSARRSAWTRARSRCAAHLLDRACYACRYSLVHYFNQHRVCILSRQSLFDYASAVSLAHRRPTPPFICFSFLKSHCFP